MSPRVKSSVARAFTALAMIPLLGGCMVPPFGTLNPLPRGAPTGAPYTDPASSWQFGQELERWGATLAGEINETQAQIQASLDAERLGRSVGEFAGEVVADLIPGVPETVGTQAGGFLGGELAKSIMALTLLLTTGAGGVLYGRHRGWDEYAEAEQKGTTPTANAMLTRLEAIQARARQPPEAA